MTVLIWNDNDIDDKDYGDDMFINLFITDCGLGPDSI